MGNHASCSPYIIPGGAAKVVHDDGRVVVYSKPIRAAELMQQNYRQFVCSAGHLRVGHRVPGLTAEEELKRHRLYFLLPMDMLYSVLTEEEMAALACRASGGVRRGVGGSVGRMMSPVLGEPCVYTSDQVQPVAATKEGFADRVSRRSWQPSLDTIHEACHP